MRHYYWFNNKLGIYWGKKCNYYRYWSTKYAKLIAIPGLMIYYSKR